jgi:hypothetical protein
MSLEQSTNHRYLWIRPPTYDSFIRETYFALVSAFLKKEKITVLKTNPLEPNAKSPSEIGRVNNPLMTSSQCCSGSG